MRKCESFVETVKMMSMSCVVHNLCIELDYLPQRNRDLTNDPSSNKERPKDEVREKKFGQKMKVVMFSS